MGSATERVTVRMMKGDPAVSWGFRLQGGQEYNQPLTIEKVYEGGLAEKAGLLEGDLVVQIGGQQAVSIAHSMAKSAISQCGNALDMVVERPATRIWKPQITPVDVPVGDMTSTPVKYSLAHYHAPQDYSSVGSGHNVQAKPFGQPQQAQPAPQERYTPKPTPAVSEHYASPRPAQSRQKVEDYLQKTGGLFGTDPKLTQHKIVEPVYLRSETLRLIKENESRSSSLGPPGTPTEAPKGHSEGTPSRQVPSNAPVCDNCGRMIHGVFCSAGGKTLHGECFKCATCGTFLKNRGYFLISGKFYCDVHSRQQREHNIKIDHPRSNNVKIAPAVPPPPPPAPTSPPQTRTIPIQYRGNEPSGNYTSSYQHYQSSKTITTGPTAGQQPYSISVITSSGITEPPPAPLSPPSHPPPPPPTAPPPSNYKSVTGGGGGQGGPVGRTPARRGRGVLKQVHEMPRVPVCESCNREIRGPFVLALNKCWCPEHFLCASAQCQRKLLDIGFIEENGMIHCEQCYEKYFAPVCSKCSSPIIGDCLTALDRQWHPDCFVCTKCHQPFGSTSFFVENGQPFCETDWNQLFTTKCFACQFPIEVGDRWVEALGNAYHSDCFNCSVCQKNLEGQAFYAKAGRPYCKAHA